MWRVWGPLALLCWSLLCVPLAQAQDFRPSGPYTHAPSGLVFPESLGGMVRASAHDYEPANPGLGMSFKYFSRSRSAFADVYVFNAGTPRIATGVGDPLVERMLKGAINDVYSAEKAGRYQEVMLVGREEVGLGRRPGAPRVLLARFTYVLPDGPVFSNIYGMATRNHFVKVRFTYRKEEADEAQGLLAAFLEDLGAVVGRTN